MNNITDFENYLLNKQYSTRTIQEHIANTKRLEQWQRENSFINEALTYNELLTYVGYLQSRKLKPQSINIQLQSITVYYEYLKEYNYIIINPAKTLRVKGAAKAVTVNVLSDAELQNTYQAYVQFKNNSVQKNKTAQQQQYTNTRNIVLLGLLIYQGLNTSELGKLQIKDIDLYKGVVYLNGAKRINARILKLEPVQILPLSMYLNSLKPTQERLCKENISNTVSRMLQELKGINQKISTVYQIRASVIIHWLKLYDKRKTQYLIGHRYISSTEKYEVQNIDGLTDLLKKYHPFG